MTHREELDRLFAAGLPDLPHAPLSDWLYHNAYTHEFGVEPLRYEPRDLTSDFLAALPDSPARDEGWVADQSLSSGAVLARKYGYARTFEPGDFLSLRGPGSRPQRGDPIVVITPRCSTLLQPDFFHFFGAAVSFWDEPSTPLRFYWNLTPESAADWIERLSTALDRFQIPFHAKCLSDAGYYSRRDSGVLYLDPRFFAAAAPAIARIASETELLDSTPLFTCPLAPGLALAESPAGEDPNESFGMNRCRRLARARSLADLDWLDRPWLNDPASQGYAWPPSIAPGPRPTGTGDFLEASVRIGALLCRDAVWHDGQVNWTADRLGADNSIVHAPLDATLYSGTAGIALFLGRLALASGENLFRRTADAARAHALAHLPDHSAGLYCGAIGILSTFHDGDSSALLESAAQPVTGQYDIMYGAAGSIQALLAHGRADLAALNGDFLISAPPPTLTGYSHGAAGIATALLDLYSATRESRYRDAALAALAWENSHYDPHQNNWPDFRTSERDFLSVWCHGSAGIALSRLRAWQILKEPWLLDEARRALSQFSALCIPSWCLCHGQAGNLDILLTASEILGEPQYRELAAEQAHEAIDLHLHRGRAWPPAMDGVDISPSLMLGLAGIGHFFLRLACPSTPSVLLSGYRKHGE